MNIVPPLLLVFGLLAGMSVGCTKKSSAGKPTDMDLADTIYVGDGIVTLNDAQPTPEALAVKDGRIIAVGARGDTRVGWRSRSASA